MTERCIFQLVSFMCSFFVVFTVFDEGKVEINLQKTSLRCVAIISLDQCSYSVVQCSMVEYSVVASVIQRDIRAVWYFHT